MNYQGQKLSLTQTNDNVAVLTFAAQDQAINKFDQDTLAELAQALDLLEQAATTLIGLVIQSDRPAFIVGADITEFLKWFDLPEEQLADKLRQTHSLFNRLSALPFPTVSAINGLALGGGFELCLATDFRVAAASAEVGLPEVKLGIYPGWGGTVRLPRLIGVDNACEWICSGAQKKAAEALRFGALDAVVADGMTTESALGLITQCHAGKMDYQGRRQQHSVPVTFSPVEKLMVFESVKSVVAAQAGRHYPAPMAAVKSIERSISQSFDDALATEVKGFVMLAKTSVAQALVGIFLKDQQVKKIARHHAKGTPALDQIGVLGAGIMGGGIAYQGASKGVRVVMKDIRPEALELGLAEAQKLLNQQIDRGRLTAPKALATLSQIQTSLSYESLEKVPLIIEAVVEKAQVKAAVLRELEAVVSRDAVIATNTSTIPIDQLAATLQHPERFCGMHFFNPVHRMPLVEVIRGTQTSAETIAKVVSLAQKLGKTPIVVNDCPGFFVNRVLFPYFQAFTQLVSDGADFRHIDKVMKGYGWPMGPAELLDTVGIDTAYHAAQTMAASFPDRMSHDKTNVLDQLFMAGLLGKKTGHGFYQYQADAKGKIQAAPDEGLALSWMQENLALTDEQIIERMMIPLCLEAWRCLDEKVIDSPSEGDMALVYGLGFPPFQGGVFHYLDSIGAENFAELVTQYQDLGALYQLTDDMRSRIEQGMAFYSPASLVAGGAA